MKNHFIIPYNGNKREEVEILYEKIKNKLDDIDIIIEPFCGSCAMSYYISTKHPNKFKYVLNDNNDFLIKLLNIMKDENKYIEFIENINKIIIKITDKETYIKHTNKDTFEGWFIGHKIYNIRPFLYPQGKPIKIITKQAPIIDFLRTENIEILNNNGIDIYEKYKNNSKSLILIDPPYIMTNNSWYKTPDTNIYEVLNNDDIKKCKSKICLMLNDNFIIKLIFKGCNIDEYDKKYQTTKKNIKHLLITNF